jgi:hypothetical protein
VSRNKVYVIVEGHGEADPPGAGQEPAAKVLIAKLLAHFQFWGVFPAKRRPRRLDSCGDFYPNTDRLLNALRAHQEFDDCAAVLALFDLDDDCPAEVGPQVAERIRATGVWPFSVMVVCAKREYEAWFWAGLPEHRYPDDPEARRGAKEWLQRELGYREVRDQSHYTDALDVNLARERSRSFRRLCHAFEELIAATQIGRPVITPLSPID